jgi:hypothetical protein
MNNCFLQITKIPPDYQLKDYPDRRVNWLEILNIILEGNGKA